LRIYAVDHAVRYQHAWALTGRLLKELASEATASGSRLALAYFPDMVNQVVLGEVSVVPRPHGPVLDGVDAFAAAFTDVAAEFERMFPRLFPGGEGRLVLTDPDDLLHTGVEVEARPPGKRIKRLSLLSGGERSLPALAVLFGLFAARPSPVYGPDAGEAALDDVNLQRFLDVVRDFRSQIIIVTHQKRTMEVADTLYGVTMQRDAVSKVISQRMGEETSLAAAGRGDPD
jgi:hypothetical protein